MTPIPIMLIEDHTLVRAGLKALLDRQEDMRVVAEAEAIAGALATIEAAQPGVILLDLTLPGGGSLDLIRNLRARECPSRVLILTMHDDPAYARSAFAAGAVGYVVKTVNERELLAAIRAVAR